MLNQVMSTTLIDPDSGESTTAITDPGDASEFVSGLIDGSWDTTFVANNGATVRASVDFDNLTFRTPQFTGRFQDLAMFEDPAGVFIVARWAAVNSRGDAFFRIEKNNPQQMTGEYTFDGSDTRRRWTGTHR